MNSQISHHLPNSKNEASQHSSQQLKPLVGSSIQVSLLNHRTAILPLLTIKRLGGCRRSYSTSDEVQEKIDGFTAALHQKNGQDSPLAISAVIALLYTKNLIQILGPYIEQLRTKLSTKINIGIL